MTRGRRPRTGGDARVKVDYFQYRHVCRALGAERTRTHTVVFGGLAHGITLPHVDVINCGVKHQHFYFRLEFTFGVTLHEFCSRERREGGQWNVRTTYWT